MDNLYKTYEKIFQAKKKWKYYKGLKIDELPLKDEETAWTFIEKYYKAGDKNEVFDKSFKKDTQRNLHSVSVFFLGILLSDLVLGKDYKNKMEPDFRYLWFIASLYHDYSFRLEGNIKDTDRFSSIEDVFKEYDVKYKIFDEGHKPTFHKNLVEAYFKYRIEKCKKLDHGIVGGILLYDRLRKNYDIAYERHNDLNPEANKECFEHNNLLWSFSQFDFFSELADTIIAHNIWFCTDSHCESIYENYKLQDLIIKEKSDFKKKHKRADNPFLFLLVLADTIEPIKRKEFVKYAPQELLEKISITAGNDEITIEVLDDTLECKAWFGSIKSLEEWMQVDVKEELKRISIKINK